MTSAGRTREARGECRVFSTGDQQVVETWIVGQKNGSSGNRVQSRNPLRVLKFRRWILGGMAPMSNERKTTALARILGQGLTRHWRIGDRNIPGQVASQRSLPPSLTALLFQPMIVWDFNHWTSEPCLPKSNVELPRARFSRMNQK